MRYSQIAFALVSKFALMVVGVALISFPRAQAEKVIPSITLGMGIMMEKDNDNTKSSSRLPTSLAAGVKYGDWRLRGEYSTFRTSDGNKAVSVSRELETAMGWISYDLSLNDSWSYYGAVAAGFGRTTIETRLNNSFENSDGTWLGVYALAAGVTAKWSEHFNLRPELRYESAERFKTKDARTGVFVQLDYFF